MAFPPELTYIMLLAAFALGAIIGYVAGIIRGLDRF